MADHKAPPDELDEIVRREMVPAYARIDHNLNTTNVSLLAMTPDYANAMIATEQARAEAERYRAEAERYRAESAVRVAEEETKQREASARQAEREAEERTKQDQETTKQAREGTIQSAHKLWRVLSASATLIGGIVGCATVPAAASSIAAMVSGVLTVAVGGSYAVEFISKRRMAKSLEDVRPDGRSSGTSPEQGSALSARRPP